MMDCRKVIEHLNDFMDGYLDPPTTQRLQEHLADCSRCFNMVAMEQKFRRTLRQMPIEPVSPGFLDDVIEHATRAEKYNRGWWVGFSTGGGIALAVMLFLLIGWPFLKGNDSVQQLAGVLIDVEIPKTIQMVVNVPEDLENSTITILLPEQIELDGYPGERVISWNADLQKGANLLALPLVAKQAGAGTLVARVEHANKRKTFEVNMEARDQLSQLVTSNKFAA